MVELKVEEEVEEKVEEEVDWGNVTIMCLAALLYVETPLKIIFNESILLMNKTVHSNPFPLVSKESIF